MNKIFDLIAKNIEKIVQKTNNIRDNLLSDELVTEYQQIKECFDNFLSGDKGAFKKVNVDRVFEIFKFDNSSYEEIKFCQKYIDSEVIPLFSEQIAKINKICRDGSYFLENQMSQYELQKQEIKNYKKEMEYLRELSLKLNQKVIDNDFIKELINFINTYAIEEEKFELLIEVSKYVEEIHLSTLNELTGNTLTDSNDEELEIISLNDTLLTDEELEELFSKYGYNYDNIKNKDRDILKQYGKIDNIMGILNEIDHYGIKINSEKFTEILIYSSGEIIRNIKKIIMMGIDNSLTDGEKDSKLKYTMGQYFNINSIFLKSSRAIEGKKGKGPGGDGGDTVPKTYDHFIKNSQFLMDLGVNINQAMEKCGSSLTIKHETFKKKYDCYMLYDIDKEIVLNTLSCLSAAAPFDCMDHFIELGCFDYLLQNFSKTGAMADDVMFYKIKKAQQEGQEIFYKRPSPLLPLQKYKLKGYISGLPLKSDPQSESSKREYVSQRNYYDGEYDWLKFSYDLYEEIINKSDNSGPLLLVKENNYVKKLDELYKVDKYHYNINGVTISRFKVLRIYETLLQYGQGETEESIMYAVCYKSILNGDEIEKIARGILNNFQYLRDRTNGGVRNK